MKIHVVKNADELKAPGDFCFFADMRRWIVKCVCGGEFSNHSSHYIARRDPLTVRPSVLCPNLCHFWIRNGAIEYESDHRGPRP